MFDRPAALLSQRDPAERLAALCVLASGRPSRPAGAVEHVNNHIHTLYSFSPYSPALAAWKAAEAGLRTAGIMDHDTLAGAPEFAEAGRILRLPVTAGLECRADFGATRLSGRTINHPDQPGVAYMALHAVPAAGYDRVMAFMKPLIGLRIERNRKMAGRLNSRLSAAGLTLSFDRDILPLSQSGNGGTVTERHLLYAAARGLAERYGRGAELLRVISDELHIAPSEKARPLLLDPDNPHYLFDLLGVLKSDFTASFYVPARIECPPVDQVLALSEEAHAISAYAYLGDVTDSVTGDKKAQKFEDDYLELLFEEIVRLGFRAVTYMPSRNTREQLSRVQALCRKHGLLQISGEDINSPRQSFVSEAQSRPEFSHLNETAWALIGHERAVGNDPDDGFFSEKSIRRWPALEERVERFAALGRGTRG